jgi:hypothetical protein
LAVVGYGQTPSPLTAHLGQNGRGAPEELPQLEQPSLPRNHGASGTGKSTLITALGERGYSVMPEFALAVVQEQAHCGGDLLPWTNLRAFMEEVFERNVQAYDAAERSRRPCSSIAASPNAWDT